MISLSAQSRSKPVLQFTSSGEAACYGWNVVGLMSSFLQGSACNDCLIYETSSPPWDEGSNLDCTSSLHNNHVIAPRLAYEPWPGLKFSSLPKNFGTSVTSLDTATESRNLPQKHNTNTNTKSSGIITAFEPTSRM
jgi:hypothetical protein